MKKLTLNLLLIFMCCCTQLLLAQDKKTGKIYCIRVTNMVGTLVNYGFYIDGKMVCKLKNNHYSIHDVPAGEHQVLIQDRGYGTGKKSKPLTVTVEEGKSYYMSVGSGKSAYLQEIMPSSADELLKKAKLNKKCLDGEQKD